MYHTQRIMVEDQDLAPFCVKLVAAFYLDDLGISFRTKNEAQQFVHKAIKILQMGNFNLTQWVSTDSSILEGVNKEFIKPLNNVIEMKNGNSLLEAPQTFCYDSVVTEPTESNPTPS